MFVYVADVIMLKALLLPKKVLDRLNSFSFFYYYYHIKKHCHEFYCISDMNWSSSYYVLISQAGGRKSLSTTEPHVRVTDLSNLDLLVYNLTSIPRPRKSFVHYWFTPYFQPLCHFNNTHTKVKNLLSDVVWWIARPSWITLWVITSQVSVRAFHYEKRRRSSFSEF